MADQKIVLPNEAPKGDQKPQGSFVESAKNLRDSAAGAAFAIDARGSAPDILMGMEGGRGLSEKNESGKERKQENHISSSGKSGNQGKTVMLGEIAFPPSRVMIRKIKTAVGNEINEIEKMTKKLAKSPLENAKSLSDLVVLLRKMRAFLSEITFKAIESLQNLWREVIAGRKISEII